MPSHNSKAFAAAPNQDSGVHVDNSVYGDTGNDTLSGTTGSDQMFGFEGDDFIFGHAGNDTLDGGVGNDRLYAGTGSDTLLGGDGDDILEFQHKRFGGDDTVDGGAGFDEILLKGNGSAKLTAANTANVEVIRVAKGFNYGFSDSSSLAAGQTLRIDGRGATVFLNPDDHTTGSFIARAASLSAYGGAGNDILVTSDDTQLVGNGGDDIMRFRNGAWGSAFGGGGNDIVVFDGGSSGYTGVGVSIGGHQLTAEIVRFRPGSSYAVNFNQNTDGIVLNASQLGTGETFTFTGPGSFRSANFFTIRSGAGDDTINLSATKAIVDPGDGTDKVTGSNTSDTVRFAHGWLDGSDTIDLRATVFGGIDEVILAGHDYLGAHALVMTSTTLVNTELLKLGNGYRYDITTADSFVAANTIMPVKAAQPDGTKFVHFDGSAEADGAFAILTGSGDDVLTGGANNDSFHSRLGDDTINGGDGNDFISFTKGQMTAADAVYGGDGRDRVYLNSDYTGANKLVMDATTMTNVELLRLAGGSSYNIATDDATVAAGETLTIDGSRLATGDKLVFDGSSETDGHFVIQSGLGGDKFTGGALSDNFTFADAADSTGTGYDTIVGFAFGTDKFDVPRTTGVITGINAPVSASLSTATFDADLAAAVAGDLPRHTATLVTANAGTLDGETFVVVDMNLVAGYQAGGDIVIHLVGATGTLAADDFI